MSSGKIIIAGATGGEVAVRLEINDFIANDKFLTLYIRALSMFSSPSLVDMAHRYLCTASMQAIDETKDGSAFGVSGIHGEPFVTWNDAVGDFAPGKWDFGGYCTHGSPLFPTWHRPYVMLVEVGISNAHKWLQAYFWYSKSFNKKLSRPRSNLAWTSRIGRRLPLSFDCPSGIGRRTPFLPMSLLTAQVSRLLIMTVSKSKLTTL